MAPTVPLCQQHNVFLQKQLPAYQARVLTGQDGVDTWSTQEIWDKFLMNVRIVISTHAILRDALAHGFVHLDMLTLLIFDEGKCS
jgi:ERCC4-related helicase